MYNLHTRAEMNGRHKLNTGALTDITDLTTADTTQKKYRSSNSRSPLQALIDSGKKISFV